MPATLLDGLLALALPVLAWRVVCAPRLFQACVLFISYGLLLSLAWVRLEAPDLALAEAGLGAGFTGALLLDALGRLGPEEPPEPRRWGQALAPAALGGALLWGLLTLPEAPSTVPEAVRSRLPASGVDNPVTAVLLNFRALDTLVEVGVLLLAAVAAWSTLAPRPEGPEDRPREAGPVLPAAARLVVPVVVLVAVYLLWAGSSRPGGAFQAAALLAGAAVLLLTSGALGPVARDGWPLRLGLVLGLALFLAVAVSPLAAGGHLLEYPPGLASPLILLVEAAATASIALVLAALFSGRRHVP